MKTNFKTFSLALCAMFAVVGCEKEDALNWNGVNGNVSLTASLSNSTIDLSKLDGAKVEFIDVRTKTVYDSKIDIIGKGNIEVPVGVYNISVESIVDSDSDVEVQYCAVLENYSVKEKIQELSLKTAGFPTASNNGGFIISEYFFNGETNSGRMMHPDQYIMITNSSLNTLYADGLSFGTTAQPSCLDKYPFYDSYMPNKIPVVGFLTVPGQGSDVPVKAGESILLAMTATNHSIVDGWEFATDLSGADYEYYSPNPDHSDVDNPAVPNLIATQGSWNGSGMGLMHPRGYYNGIVFKLENGKTETISAFAEKNTETYTAENEEETDLIIIKAEMILDGVVSGDAPNGIVSRPLPATVDRGQLIVSGCHRQELGIRKTITVDGKSYFQDTNNSSVDFEIRKGQSSFPVGWRK